MMFCSNCGEPLDENDKFCPSCGVCVKQPDDAGMIMDPVTSQGPDYTFSNNIEVSEAAVNNPVEGKPKRGGRRSSAQKIMHEGTRVTPNIILCEDGKYRWIYEYRMLKNPAILITVQKVILLSFCIVMGFMTLLNLIDGSFRYWNRSDFISFYGGFVILLLVILVLGAVSYLILAAIYGWTYQVLLTMDEEGIELRQMSKGFQKAQAVGWLTEAAGRAAGNIGLAGTGILAATRDSSTSVFQHVRKVRAVRRRQVIYVNQLLGHNQVYAEDADFDFVWEFIVEHCPNAKISGQ